MNGVFSVRNLLIALGIGIAFLVLSYVLIVGNSQTPAFDTEVLRTIFNAPIIGSRFMWNQIWFVAALVLLHAGFGFVCWVLGSLSAAGAGITGADQSRHSRQHVVLWTLFLCFALLAYNAANFPRSSIGARYALIGTKEIAGFRLGSLIAYALLFAALLAAARGLSRIWRGGWRPRNSSPRLAIAALGVVALGGIAGFSTYNGTHNHSDKPNIVLIGIDSLRADMVGEHAAPGAVPHIRDFLKESVWFRDTTTPLARTFPAVVSLMSGRDPHTTGAYMNLPPRGFIKEGDTLSRILARQGYRSMFVMDEVRFANFDTSYGFDQVITPTPGATEFIQGLIADTPLSNLIMNSMLGALLFPHVHANRGAGATYDPDSFVRLIERRADFTGPLLFHAHLTLGHWPYTWSDAPLPKEKINSLWPDYYITVSNRVDQQYADIMEVLRKRGVLDNAIVVVYSDHGESFGRGSESLVPTEGLVAALGARPRWGHGSTVFSMHQYKVVLGMRGYGKAEGLLPRGKQVNAPATIMDVTPTFSELLAAPSKEPFDGLSLMPLMADAPVPAQFEHRVRFTETEYNPPGIASASGELHMSSIAEAAKLYRIDPNTDRVHVREELTGYMLTIRQFCAIGDEVMLAAIPYYREDLSHQFVVFNKSGGWPYLLDGPPTQEDPPELERVWDAMQVHLKGEIPTGEKLAEVVAKSPVATSGQ